ncbi:MAG TPA: VWA domain-containing protein [Terracidiphilus sp.]|nr:VWA domain-containing protein [Terracidiphilus sp.]
MRLHALGLIAVMAAWCFTAGVQGQTAASNEKEPVLKVRAHAVVVDVVVTRENGEAVTLLRKENFKVTEDGKEQFIDFFEEHFAKTLPPGAIPPMPKLPPSVYTNVPPVPESDSVNILLLDSLNTPVQDQSNVHKQIMDYLKTMEPGTRAAIFLLGSKLRFVQGFTTDASLLSAALNDKKNAPEKEIPLRTREDDADDARQLDFMREAANGHTTGGMMAIRDADHEVARYQLSARISMTLEALNYLARYLGGVPGRKNLIWFASSFPVTVFPTYGQMATLNDNLHVQASEIKKTADLLTVSKVAVYPVGAEGMMNDHWLEANQNLTEAGHGGSLGRNIMGDNTERSNQIMAMEQLASDTGGKAFFNTNDLHIAIKRAIDDGAHYYTLAYTPTNNKLDGSYRRIEVKVSATGKYKTAYRHGYNADDLKTADARPESDPLLPLLKYGLPDVSQLLYGVRVTRAAQQPAPNAKRAGMNSALTGPVTRYAIDFLIRWTDVNFALRPDGIHHGKIQLALQAYDRGGKAVNWEDGTQEMNMKPEIWAAIQKSGIPAHMEIDLPNEDIYLNTGVYDWGTTKAGTLAIPLSPAKAASAQSVPPTPGEK